MTVLVPLIDINSDTWGDAIDKINDLIPLVPDDFVTSVQISTPTGLTATGGPITSSGTIALGYQAGYVGYTQAERNVITGLGTASSKNTGTSGDAVPLLDGNNTWSGTATFSSTMSITGATSHGAGIDMGSAFASANTNLIRHFSLYSTTYGFNATSNFLNYVVPATGSHRFYSGTTITGTLANTGNLTLSGFLDVASGGTGAKTASDARTNLGLGALSTLNPTGTPSAGTFLRGDNTWATPVDSGGTVTSVGMSVPAGFNVSGSPITSSGTLTVTYAAGFTGYTTAEQSKLSGIAAGATANQSDAYLLNRANHTGTLAINAGGTGATTANAAATALGLGTGDSPQFTGINLGHASDTTITRPSAGNLAIEGNLIYRAAGTDVAVADGGTGASTAAAARTNLGVAYGTTAGTVAEGNDSRIVSAVPNTRTISAGTGLTGGGDLTANRSFAVSYGTTAGTAAEGNDSRITGAVQKNITAQLTTGYTATSDNDGTKSSGTYTPNPAEGNFKHIVNGGAFTLAAPAGVHSMIIEITNNASAGTITMSGFTKVGGAPFTTVNGDKFLVYIARTNSYTHANVAALQ